MDNSKYEAVRAKIVDSCDELKHPRIKIFNKEDYVRYEHKAIKVPSHVMFWLENLPNLGWEVGEIETNEWSGEVRIHEKVVVRLSNVLRAIEKQPGMSLLDFALDSDGWFIQRPKGSHGFCRVIRYDLTQDDLSLQSTDTIDFLFKILCE